MSSIMLFRRSPVLVVRIVSDRRVRNGGGCSLATPFGVGGGFPAGGNGDGGGRDLLCWLLALLLLLLLSEDVSMLDVLLTSAPSPLPAARGGRCHIFILQHANKDSYPNVLLSVY
jgi:hypothetical protein